MYETRHQFIETLRGCERQTIAALTVALRAVDRVVAAVHDHDLALAQAVVADDVALDRAQVQVNDCVLRVIATQAPVAGDLRIVTALLEAIRRIERIGDQCVNVAKLIALSGREPRRDRALLEMVVAMGEISRSYVAGARDAFEARSVAGFSPDCEQFSRLGHQILERAVAAGDDHDTREWAMHMVLVARAFGRIADNSRAIAELGPFVASGTRVGLVPRLEAV